MVRRRLMEDRDMEQKPRIALRLAEAAEAVGVSPRTLAGWADAGRVPHRRVGRVRLFFLPDLKRWAAGREGDQ